MKMDAPCAHIVSDFGIDFCQKTAFVLNMYGLRRIATSQGSGSGRLTMRILAAEATSRPAGRKRL